MAKVSIILPVYNSEKYLKDTIKSVLNQTYTDWELIIVDDGSKDASLDVINSLKNEKIIFLKNEKNMGAAFSRNKAIEKATGRYLAFIDSDDIWEKEKLEKQIKYMEENGYVFTFSSYDRIKENGESIGIVYAPLEISFNDILNSTPIQISTIIIDTKQVNKKLIKMQEIKTSEDIAMYLKILKTGIVANGIQECFVKYKVRKHSLSSNRVINTIRRWKLYKQYNLSFKERLKNIIKHIINALKRTKIIKKQSRLKEIISLITLRQIFEMIFFPITWLISIIYKTVLPKDIWIIEENPSEACDNGYIFFKYIRENIQDINAYYVIEKKSKDYQKVMKFGNVIQHGSLKHWIYYLNAKKIIVTQKYANPSMALFYLLHKNEFLKIPRIFLRHGIAKDNCEVFYYNNTKFRLFICGAKKEFEYVKEKFQYPKQNVVYTGLARFDNLELDINGKNKIILIAPTWRKWIKKQKEFDDFLLNYYKILNDEKLIKCIEDNNVQIKLVLHKNMKKFKINDLNVSKNITIHHNGEIDIQDIINKTDLLITDFSSIFFDIAYRKRPIIYYQFDKNRYRMNHLKEGYFSYEEDGFGEVFDNEKLVVDKIIYYIENNFKIEKEYSNRIDGFFERRDKNNCQRILEEIEKI